MENCSRCQKMKEIINVSFVCVITKSFHFFFHLHLFYQSYVKIVKLHVFNHTRDSRDLQ